MFDTLSKLLKPFCSHTKWECFAGEDLHAKIPLILRAAPVIGQSKKVKE
jgi:hypothetical protein